MAMIHTMWDLADYLLEVEIALLPSSATNLGNKAAADLCDSLGRSLRAAQFADLYLWDRVAFGAAQMICPLNGDGVGVLIESALENIGKTEVLEGLRKRFNAIRMHMIVQQSNCDEMVYKSVMNYLPKKDHNSDVTDEKTPKLDALVLDRSTQIGKAMRILPTEAKVKYLIAQGVRPHVIVSALQG